jgi:hypothetical protein
MTLEDQMLYYWNELFASWCQIYIKMVALKLSPSMPFYIFLILWVTTLSCI